MRSVSQGWARRHSRSTTRRGGRKTTLPGGALRVGGGWVFFVPSDKLSSASPQAKREWLGAQAPEGSPFFVREDTPPQAKDASRSEACSGLSGYPLGQRKDTRSGTQRLSVELHGIRTAGRDPCGWYGEADNERIREGP